MIKLQLVLGLILLGLLTACALPLPPLPETGGLRQVQPTDPVQPTQPVQPMDPVQPTEQPTSEAEPGSLLLRTLTEEQRRPNYFVFSNYPYLAEGFSAETTFAFNQAVEGLLLQELALFKIDLASLRAERFGFSHPSTFLSGFQIHTATRSLVSLEMDLSVYHAGAAHPLPSTLTVTFSLESGQALILADVFAPGAAYLERLSELATGQLRERGTLLSDADIAPTADNFVHWVVNPHGLILIFDVYQVSAYAAGVQRITIPFDQLTGLLADGAPPPGLAAEPLNVERMLMPIQSPDPALLEA